MSMHEIEDVVEASIRILAQHQNDHSLDLRGAFQALYNFQELHDTGFTNFRVMNLLLQHGYTQRFARSEHPDYTGNQKYFDGLTDFEFINLLPPEPWHAKSNPVVAYFDEGHLYYDLDSPHWDRMQELGLISAENALPAGDHSFSEVVAQVLELAEKDGDIELIRMWYPLFILGFDDWQMDGLQRLKDDPHVRAIRETTERTNALAIEMNYGATSLPSLEDVRSIPVLEWWFNREDLLDAAPPQKQVIATPEGELHLAINSGDLEAIQSLIEGGLSPDALMYGDPVLVFVAAMFDRAEIIQYLIEQGANLEAQGPFGFTPLSSAANAINVENVHLLLAAGADVNPDAHGGYSPLIATLYNRPDLKQLDSSEARETALEIVRALIDAGADVNRRAGDGGSALHRAVSMEDLDLVRILLDAGAAIDPAQTDPTVKLSPVLHGAVKSGNQAITKLLLDSGASLVTQDAHGQTALLMAIEDDQLEMMDLLLGYTNAINQPQGMYNYMPLTWASAKGSNLAIIERLIDSGGDPEAKDHYRRTAIRVALILNNQPLIEWFRHRFPDLDYRLPGRMGIALWDTEEQERALLQTLNLERGVPLKNVLLDSAADAADLRVNDVIQAINDAVIDTRAELYAKLSDLYEGDIIQCKILRAGEQIELEIPLTFVSSTKMKFSSRNTANNLH